MEHVEDSFSELRSLKRKYLYLFYVQFLGGPLVRALEMYRGATLLSGLLGLVLLGLAVWFAILTFRFARALDGGLVGTPINFFTFDVAPAA